MKWLTRSLMFAVSFVLGLLTAGLGSSITWQEPPSPVAVYELESSPTLSGRTPDGIKIMYAGWDPSTGGLGSRLKFVIYNGTLLPITYSAHTPDDPWAEIRVEGIEQDQIYGCGTGIKTFYILPSMSAEVAVTPSDFTRIPTGSQKITAGFHLRSVISESDDVHTSEPFTLPEEFRTEIRVWSMPK